jgi:glycosyltransferase involved in cell wall biosynthesis
LEAIASGTPVVAHRSGGIQEFINERCGRLIDSSDPLEWATVCTGYLDLIVSQADFHAAVRACAWHFDWHETLKPALDIIVNVSNSSKPDS